MSTIVAEALLIVLAVAAAIIVYLWVSGFSGAHEVKHTFASFKVDAVNATDTGFYVWIHGVTGRARISIAYLEYPWGGLAAVLHPVAPEYTVEAGETVLAHFVPDRSVEPGTYRLRIAGSDDVGVSVIVTVSIGSGHVFHVDLGKANVTSEFKGYNITFVAHYEDGYYSLTVYVCAKPGTYVYKVIGVIYNSSMKPPIHVGQYYRFIDDYASNPFTYPDCNIEFWTPLYTYEQPYHIAILVLTTPPR